MKNGNAVIPFERLREWVLWLRKEAIKLPLDSAMRDTLWDLSTVISEEVPIEIKDRRRA